MSKRGHGEGSIYQRPDGRWCAEIFLGWADGKKQRKYFYGDTRRKVAEKLKKALRDQQLGLPQPDDRQTVEIYLDSWLVDVKPSLRPRTYDSYEEICRLHLKPKIGHVVLSKLSARHVRNLLKAKKDEGFKPRRVQRIHAVLRTALGQAVRDEQIPRNVAKLVKPPPASRYKGKVLTPEQAKQLLDAVHGTRLEGFCAVAVAMGLRIGECLGLLWTDIDWDEGTLTVSGQIQRQKGKGLVRLEPKSKTGLRTLQMPVVVVTVLKKHRARQLQKRLLAGDKWEEHGLVFVGLRGRPLDPKDMLVELHGALEKAQLPRVGWHDLRRSCASLLAAQGVPPATAMLILGHSTITLTMDVYTSVLPDALKDAAERVDRVLRRDEA